MKALIQRVDKASVSVDDSIVGKINRGLLVLVGVSIDDTDKDIEYLVDKVLNMRIFPDEDSKFNLSVKDINGEIMVISQFTLLADTRKGRRPSFTEAAPPDKAEAMFNDFVRLISGFGLNVQTGKFQQHMIVDITNNGPVTIMVDSRDKISPAR